MACFPKPFPRLTPSFTHCTIQRLASLLEFTQMRNVTYIYALSGPAKQSDKYVDRHRNGDRHIP